MGASGKDSTDTSEWIGQLIGTVLIGLISLAIWLASQGLRITVRSYGRHGHQRSLRLAAAGYGFTILAALVFTLLQQYPIAIWLSLGATLAFTTSSGLLDLYYTNHASQTLEAPSLNDTLDQPWWD